MCNKATFSLISWANHWAKSIMVLSDMFTIGDITDDNSSVPVEAFQRFLADKGIRNLANIKNDSNFAVAIASVQVGNVVVTLPFSIFFLTEGEIMLKFCI